jgi:cell division transport system permease protein
MKKRRPINQTTDLGKTFRVWLAQHAQSFISSLGQLHKNPIGNLFSMAVIGISLALPAGFYLVLDNAQRVLENWDGTIQIALYLRPEVTAEQASALHRDLSGHELIEGVTLITKEEALEEYKRFSGFAEALDALEENPLPSMLLIQPRLDALSSTEGEGLLLQMGRLPEVENAQYDRQWVKRLLVILHILQRAVIILATLLSIAVLLIIGNTIRLSIINKRTEIEINKLFGATNSFIQRPFLYSGFIYGIAGSLFAWGLLLISLSVMTGPINQLASLYNSDFQLQGLNLKEVCVLIASGGGLGLLGSWIAVGRHIRAVEPM